MVNRAIIIGNLGKDPTLTFTPNGNACCKFSVATTEKWNDQQGAKQEKTTWHNIVVWGKQAEACGQYLTKGRQCFIEGRIENRSYEKDGQTKYISEIVASNVRFLGGRGEASQQGGGGDAGEPIDDDSIPFATAFPNACGL